MGTRCCSATGAARAAVASLDAPSRSEWCCVISCSVTVAAIDGRLWSSTMSMLIGWATPWTLIPPLVLIQFWQKRYPSLAIWPPLAWLPVRERTAPTLIGSPVGRLLDALGLQAARTALSVMSPSKISRDRGTVADYGLARPAMSRGPLTVLLIAAPARTVARVAGRLSHWPARRVSQVVRQRSAKPPPRVRIPHSPPSSKYDLPAKLVAE